MALLKTEKINKNDLELFIELKINIPYRRTVKEDHEVNSKLNPMNEESCFDKISKYSTHIKSNLLDE
jgi:hypothetical protein